MISESDGDCRIVLLVLFRIVRNVDVLQQLSCWQLLFSMQSADGAARIVDNGKISAKGIDTEVHVDKGKQAIVRCNQDVA